MTPIRRIVCESFSSEREPTNQIHMKQSELEEMESEKQIAREREEPTEMKDNTFSRVQNVEFK